MHCVHRTDTTVNITVVIPPVHLFMITNLPKSSLNLIVLVNLNWTSATSRQLRSPVLSVSQFLLLKSLFKKLNISNYAKKKCFLSNFNFASGSLLYLYDLFRGFELQRFDGPAGGSSLSEPTHRDDITEAATDYETDSGSDSEADPDHFCSVPRNARGVDMKLVSISSR